MHNTPVTVWASLATSKTLRISSCTFSSDFAICFEKFDLTRLRRSSAASSRRVDSMIRLIPSRSVLWFSSSDGKSYGSMWLVLPSVIVFLNASTIAVTAVLAFDACVSLESAVSIAWRTSVHSLWAEGMKETLGWSARRRNYSATVCSSFMAMTECT